MPVVPPDPALRGRWQRTLLIRPDGTCDTTSTVTWLQAGSYYVDLRLPLDPARTEGFAGRVRADGPWTCWDRVVDLRPSGGPDEGRLEADGPDALVETGRHEAYVEHWARRAGPAVTCCAVELRDAATGAPAVLVRVGDDVAWARGGTAAEVALGTVARGGVVLTASSLPSRAGAPLELVADGAGLREIATGPDGTPLLRRWHVVATEGAAAALPVRRPRPVVRTAREVRTA
ncbi:hypothetical protein [Geodermatophilus sp. SYSU D00815]